GRWHLPGPHLLLSNKGGAQVAAESVISRAEWGAVPPKSRAELDGPARKAVVHHTALAKCSGLSGCRDLLRSIQRFHMDERGFDDIGYNFLVGCDGSVFQGRGWGVVGAHAKGHNHDSVGIAFMGNYNEDAPSSEAVSAVRRLLQSGLSQGFLQPASLCWDTETWAAQSVRGDKLYAVLSERYFFPHAEMV
uniref:Peptidoglycan recognition protein 5 n=1 Tax=Tetraodon nigroviridis TaxID=99883 RepID=H3BXH0_TETNG